MQIQHPSSPNSDTQGTGTPSSASELHAVVRRARVEHLAAELLREAQLMHAPVPVNALYQQPPLNLWPPIHTMLPADTPEARLVLARLVARKVGESAWSLRDKLFGSRTFSASEIEMFAVALLLPSPLLGTLNPQQRTPAGVAQLFGVPLPVAAQRLVDLGYTPRDSAARAGNDTTTQ